MNIRADRHLYGHLKMGFTIENFLLPGHAHKGHNIYSLSIMNGIILEINNK
jgi:hypothetical protein